ncbi:MAG: hypothetical protein WA989_16355 [Henriciella sp.]|uniref:hypothetical protein n=1 Tax=Henriciella sp. TaxID=1968823 RepID=UPI003C736C26
MKRFSTRCVIAVVAIVSGPFAATAEDAPLPALEPGSSVFWNSIYEGGQSTFREIVVAAGDDWVLFESKFDDQWSEDVTAAENLFLVFSGIDYRSCADGPLPSREERAAVKALRPFKAGDTVELTTPEGSPTVTVGEAENYFLMGEMRPAHKIFVDFEDDEFDENLVVLDDMDLTVAIDWDEQSRDKIMSVTSGKPGAATGFTEEELGICAPLLVSG